MTKRETLNEILSPRLSPEVLERARREYAIVKDVAKLSGDDARAELAMLREGPEIREGDELTPKRREAWNWWCVLEYLDVDEARWVIRKRIEIHWIFNAPPSAPDRVVGCYPCHGGQPWRWATWEEVDEAVEGCQS